MSDEKKTTEDKVDAATPATPEAEPKAPVEEAKEESAKAEEKTEAETKEAAPEAEAPAEAEAKEDAPADEATDAAPEVTEEAADEEKEAVVEELPHRDIKAGMIVRIHEVIKDTNAKGEERERVQIFEGTVLGISGERVSRTMTVRKVSGGIGVEKIYPLSSPHVSKIEVVREYRTRRAKLWFLRRGKLKRRMKEIRKDKVAKTKATK